MAYRYVLCLEHTISWSGKMHGGASHTYVQLITLDTKDHLHLIDIDKMPIAIPKIPSLAAGATFADPKLDRPLAPKEPAARPMF